MVAAMADGHRPVTRGMSALTRALRRTSGRVGRKGRTSETEKARGKGCRKKGQRPGREGTQVSCTRGRLDEGTAEEAEKGELSLAAEFLRRATQGEAEVNPHQRSSRRLKIPALAIFMTVSSTGETTTAARRIARPGCEDSHVPVTCATKRYTCYDVFRPF